MRVYLPATTQTLRLLLETGAVEATPITAFAVTPGLREWYAEEPDDEELEYAASAEAARASVRVLATAFGSAPRRVVLAADVADVSVDVRDDLDRGVVRISAAVQLTDIASIHIDEAEAEEAVRIATGLIDRADLGDPQAQEAVDDAEGFELSWYATQELPDLLARLDGPTHEQPAGPSESA
jgi:hypothetical protein